MADINKIITRTSKEAAELTAAAVVSKLKKQGLMKDTKRTPFQKTEQLLYNYNNFKAAIEDKREQAKAILCQGLPRRSKSITSWTNNSNGSIALTDKEKEDEKIQAIESSIAVTEKFIAIIDEALNKISNDSYFSIIKLKYFEGKSREEIAEELNVDVSTVTRNKNRLINILKIKLFSDEAIQELFN